MQRWCGSIKNEHQEGLHCTLAALVLLCVSSQQTHTYTSFAVARRVYTLARLLQTDATEGLLLQVASTEDTTREQEKRKRMAPLPTQTTAKVQ